MNVVEIRRYPVKAMAGESLDSVLLDARGLVGDRRFAVLDDDGRMATGKDSRRFRRRDAVFDFRASTVDEGVRVEGRGGSWLVGDSALDEALTASMGAHVLVTPEGDVSYYDASPVSLVGTASLAWCREHLGVDGDPRRLRMNLLVDTDEPFVEDTWVGRIVRTGGVQLCVAEPTERCRMVDIAQEGLPAQPGWLKALGAERHLCLGVYAEVVAPGRLAVGDAVEPDSGG